MQNNEDNGVSDLASVMFYFINWFQLDKQTFAAIVREDVDSACTLVATMQKFCEDESNFRIEQWCQTSHSKLAGMTPSALMRRDQHHALIRLQKVVLECGIPTLE